MDPHEIVPTSQLGDRIPEHGRIRLGVKTARAMKALETFRFTSPDMIAISHLASLYGGQARPWADPKAVPQNQWEVITASSEIEVWLPPSAVTVWYEMWAGGGCVRRCDGTTCRLNTRGDEGWAEVDCVCREQNERKCKPYTRLKVLLPGVPSFAGVWRLETKGWNAANELPAIERLLDQFSSVGLVPGKLLLEQRQTDGGGKRFVVPKLVLGSSLEEIATGRMRQVGALAQAMVVEHMALGVGNVAVEGDDDPEDIEEAELVEEVATPNRMIRHSVAIGQLLELAERVAESRPDLKTNANQIITALTTKVAGEARELDALTDLEVQRCVDALAKVARGETIIKSVTADDIQIVRKK